jgi:hypothetical protein
MILATIRTNPVQDPDRDKSDADMYASPLLRLRSNAFNFVVISDVKEANSGD